MNSSAFFKSMGLKKIWEDRFPYNSTKTRINRDQKGFWDIFGRTFLHFTNKRAEEEQLTMTAEELKNADPQALM